MKTVSAPPGIPLPREHGAYVVLVCAWLLGVMHAPGIDQLPMWSSLVVALMVFLIQEPIRRLLQIRRTGRGRNSRHQLIVWAAGFGITGMTAAIPLVILRPFVLWQLLPAGLILGLYALLLNRRASMDTLAPVGFIGLSLAAPLARLGAADGNNPWELLGLWLLAALFFCGSSYCVRIRLKGKEGVAPAIGCHILGMILVGMLVLIDLLPPIAIAAMLPAAGRLLWILTDVDRYRRLPLKHIGLLESAFSFLFIALYALHH